MIWPRKTGLTIFYLFIYFKRCGVHGKQPLYLSNRIKKKQENERTLPLLFLYARYSLFNSGTKDSMPFSTSAACKLSGLKECQGKVCLADTVLATSMISSRFACPLAPNDKKVKPNCSSCSSISW